MSVLSLSLAQGSFDSCFNSFSLVLAFHWSDSLSLFPYYLLLFCPFCSCVLYLVNPFLFLLYRTFSLLILYFSYARFLLFFRSFFFIISAIRKFGRARVFKGSSIFGSGGLAGVGTESSFVRETFFGQMKFGRWKWKWKWKGGRFCGWGGWLQG